MQFVFASSSSYERDRNLYLNKVELHNSHTFPPLLYLNTRLVWYTLEENDEYIKNAQIRHFLGWFSFCYGVYILLLNQLTLVNAGVNLFLIWPSKII